jgi:hypothetical protein
LLVLHVPQLNCNFFSIKQLTLVGGEFWLSGIQTYRYNIKYELIATCTFQNDLHTLDQSQYFIKDNANQKAMAISFFNTISIWHKCLVT